MKNVFFLCYKVKFPNFLQTSILAPVTFEVDQWFLGFFFFFLDGKLIKLLKPYCPIITTFTNTVMTWQFVTLTVAFDNTLVC